MPKHLQILFDFLQSDDVIYADPDHALDLLARAVELANDVTANLAHGCPTCGSQLYDETT